MEKAIEAMRDLSNSFKKRNLKPIECGNKVFIVEFPNENSLRFMMSSSPLCRGGGAHFHFTKWTGNEHTNTPISIINLVKCDRTFTLLLGWRDFCPNHWRLQSTARDQ